MSRLSRTLPALLLALLQVNFAAGQTPPSSASVTRNARAGRSEFQPLPGRVIGVLTVISTRRAAAFSPLHIEVLAILAKLGVGNRTEAVSKAAQLRLIEL